MKRGAVRIEAFIVIACCGAVASSTFASEWKGTLAVNVGGGSGLTQPAFRDGGPNHGVRSMTYGSGELDLGATEVGDDGLAQGKQWAVIFRSSGFGPAAWDRAEPSRAQPAWSGGGLGLRGGWTVGRIDGTASVVFGSVGADPERSDVDPDAASRMVRSYVQPGVALGVTLWRSRSFDLKLRAAYEPMLFDQVLTYEYADGTEAAFTNHLDAHHLGLSFAFYPAEADWGSGSSFNFIGHCDYSCGRVLVETGRVLVEVGSLVGRAAASGVFRALAR